MLCMILCPRALCMVWPKSKSNNMAIKLLLIFTGKISVPSGYPPKKDKYKNRKNPSWWLSTKQTSTDLMEQKRLVSKFKPVWSDCSDILDWVGDMSDAYQLKVSWYGTALLQNKAVKAGFTWTVKWLHLQWYWFLTFDFFKNLAEHQTGCIHLNIFLIRKYKYSRKVYEVLWVYWFMLLLYIYLYIL